MRKTIVAIVAAIAFLSTGCTVNLGTGSESPSASESASPSPSEPESFAPESDNMSESEYLRLLRETDPWFNDVEDKILIDNAQVVCDALDSGLTVEEVVDTMVNSGIPAFSAGVLIQGGVFLRCPENQNLVDDFASSTPGSSV